MNTMVLSFAGYGLLLSSCVALAFLLRISCSKEAIRSPLHIFSTSDTLISIVTSIILLVNQSLSSFNFVQKSPIGSVSKITDRQLLSHNGDKEYNQNRTCMRMDIQEIDGSTPNCTFRHVLMHYAIFLIPFANAFVSLLIYSVQCNSGMTCFTKKCSKLIKSSKTVEICSTKNAGSASTSRKRDLSNRKDVNEVCTDPEAGMLDEKNPEVSHTISNEGNLLESLKKNLKSTGFGLTTQWLIPVLTTAILYLSKTQNMKDVRESSEMDCIFKVNFPLESCGNTGLYEPEDQINQKKNHEKSTGYFGVEEPDTLRISHSDSVEIDEVVSRVRKVIQSAFNKTCNDGSELNDRRDFEPWNITRYIIMNNFTQQLKTHGVEILGKLSDQSLGISGSKNCTNINDNDWSNEDTEAFGDVELDLSQDIVETSEFLSTVEESELSDLDLVRVTTDTDNATENITIINQTGPTFHKVSTEHGEINAEAENRKKKLNHKIQAEIIKQIRDVVGQVEVREETRNKQESNNEKFNSGSIDEQSGINKIRTSLPKSEERRAREDKKTYENVFSKVEAERQSQVLDDKNQGCFLSVTFLKIHLLILLFAVYFLSVLISAVLQTRATYMCKNVFEKIESVNQKLFPVPSITGQSFESSRIIRNENSLKPGWFSGGINDVKTIATENLSTGQNFEDMENLDNNSHSQEDRKTGYKSVMEEAKSMQMLFAILKKSLLLSMLMWTPAFLEILSKVFLCTSSPAWLANGFYLLGISFGIVKNFLNVSIAKIDKSMSDQIHGKDNSVHPSAQN